MMEKDVHRGLGEDELELGFDSSKDGLMDPRVLVLGGQGAFGAVIASTLSHGGFTVLRGGRRDDAGADFRRIELSDPESFAAPFAEVDFVVNAIPDPELRAEQFVLQHGGTLLNVSALPPTAALTDLSSRLADARGTVVMNVGVSPGMTNLVAAHLLAEYPDADEVEIAFVASARASGTGLASRQWAARGVRAARRHHTAIIPLPAPYGPVRGLAFAEPERGWLGQLAGDRRVNMYLCLAEPRAQRVLLAANRVGLSARLPQPRPAEPKSSGRPLREADSLHWVGVLKRGRRMGGRSIHYAGDDYQAGALATLGFLNSLISKKNGSQMPLLLAGGVYRPDEVLTLDQLVPYTDPLGIRLQAEPTP